MFPEDFMDRAVIAMISLALAAEVLSLLITGDIQRPIAWIEFVSMGVYFVYLGIVGFLRMEGDLGDNRHVGMATILITIDVAIFLITKGW